MTADKYAMSEKIMQEINNILQKDPNLNEFEIIPMPSNQNKSPVLYVDHCLGLESWCTKYLYCYVYDMIMITRKQRKKTVFDDDLIKQLNCALLLNPDVSTFWNMRREFVERKYLSISAELNFSQLVLSRKHKCNDAFSYRRWLISKHGGELSLSLLNTELHISQICADRSPCNCHAWTHRNWVMQKYLQFNPLYCNPNSISSNPCVSVLLQELNFSEFWISNHVSDYSGFHYRQFLLETLRCSDVFIFDQKFLLSEWYIKSLNNLNDFLFNNNEDKIDINNITSNNMILHLYNYTFCTSDSNYQNRLIVITLLIIYDLVLCQQLSDTFQNHESIFCHRRYIIQTLFNVINELYSSKINLELINLNKLYTHQQCDRNIVTCLDVDQLYSNAVNSPKKTKHEYPLHCLIRAVISNEKKNVCDPKYLKWCQFILHVPLS